MDETMKALIRLQREASKAWYKCRFPENGSQHDEELSKKLLDHSNYLDQIITKVMRELAGC